MKVRWKFIIVILLAVTVLSPGLARAECDLHEVVGYTLAAIKTIAGRIDKDGRNDDYQGCDFDRILVFDDNTGVRCTTYTYSYSYRPRAYIWAGGGSIRMCVAGSYMTVAPLQ